MNISILPMEFNLIVVEVDKATIKIESKTKPAKSPKVFVGPHATTVPHILIIFLIKEEKKKVKG